jgi:hypothetical protein
MLWIVIVLKNDLSMIEMIILKRIEHVCFKDLAVNMLIHIAVDLAEVARAFRRNAAPDHDVAASMFYRLLDSPPVLAKNVHFLSFSTFGRIVRLFLQNR